MHRIRAIEALAEISVGRACGFAALGIFTVMVGFSFDPLASFRAGAMLTTLLAFVLWWRAQTVWRRPYKRTEVWTMMMGEERRAFPEPRMQQVVTEALKTAYLRHARLAVWGAIAFWGLALLIWIDGLIF